MSKCRKSFEAREKDLRFALLRIKRGRANTGAPKLSVTSVAREAGVSAALIHNHYPAVADAIRRELTRDGRKRGNHMQKKFENERGRALRAEISDLRAQVARLATINEVLRFENEFLRAKGREDVVVSLSSSRAVSNIPSSKHRAGRAGKMVSASNDTDNSLGALAR